MDRHVASDCTPYTGSHPEHLSFVLFDEAREASQPMALFSGDFLFVGSLGRPDLRGEHAKQRLPTTCTAACMNASPPCPIACRFTRVMGQVRSGSGMSDRAESTLGYERLSQPLFQLTKEAFVQEILASVPPMPSYYPRMKKLNAKGASSVAKLPGNAPLTPACVAALLADEAVTIIDLRRPEAFGGAHIPGALNIGAGQNLSLWAGWLLDPEQRFILVNDTGDDEASRRSLVRVGLERIEGFLQKGMPAWVDAGLEFTRTAQLSTNEVAERGPDTQVLDVRGEKEWSSGHIQDATPIPLGELKERMVELQKDSDIIAICGSGYRSSIAASLLQANGFTSISSMDGGMKAWNQRSRTS